MSGLQAVRVAAAIRRELGTQVDMIHGRYGEFKILVDNDVVLDAGALAILGVVPTKKAVLKAVKERLSA